MRYFFTHFQKKEEARNETCESSRAAFVGNHRKEQESIGNSRNRISDKIDLISDLYYDISDWRWNMWETIMISACLAGENCKYNGGNNRNEKVLQLMAENEVITVCPEQMGGLPTPRVPSEIRDGVVTAKDGRIVDSEFRAGAEKCLEIARREQPDLIVLQSRSPSCGVKQRYDGTFSGTLVDGAGVTAQLLMENGFRCVDVEDL